MNQSLKAVMTLLGIVVAFAGVVYWTGAYTPKLSLRSLLIGIGLCAAGGTMLGLVVWSNVRPERMEDQLRKIIAKPFERAGLCFGFLVVSENGSSGLDVYYQNRYARPCRCTIWLRSAEGEWRLDPIEINCEGAAFGVLRRLIAVPLEARGHNVMFEVIAETKYWYGRGRLRRFREGLSVGRLGRTGRNLAMIGAAATGHLHVVKPARVRLRMPENMQWAE